MTDLCERLDADGFALLEGVLSADETDAARRSCAAALAHPAAASALLIRDGGQPHGARNLLRLWPGSIALGRHPRLRPVLLRLLDPAAGLVRGLYFDKPPGTTWALPWHRDTTIAVKAHGGFTTYCKPTIKAGVPHVEAPAALMAQMLTARVHLDDMTDRNGPLRVVPGSHHPGGSANERPPVAVHCRAGDVLLMRPLLLHASGHCDPEYQGHRRIVHLELAPEVGLSDGYEWQDFVGVTG